MVWSYAFLKSQIFNSSNKSTFYCSLVQGFQSMDLRNMQFPGASITAKETGVNSLLISIAIPGYRICQLSYRIKSVKGIFGSIRGSWEVQERSLRDSLMGISQYISGTASDAQGLRAGLLQWLLRDFSWTCQEPLIKLKTLFMLKPHTCRCGRWSQGWSYCVISRV